MVPFVRTAAASLALLAAAATANAQRTVSLTFSQLGMDRAVHGDIVALATDATNRLWVVTEGRVSAVLGDARAPIFPLDKRDDSLPATAAYRDVTFVELEDGENFFLASTQGIARGRITANGEEYGSPLVRGGAGDEDRVSAVGSHGMQFLWAATAGGVVQWDLTDQPPTHEETFLDDEGPFGHLAVAPWGHVLTTSGNELFLVENGGSRTPPPIHTLSSGRSFRALAFDDAGNLWAVTDVPGAQIMRFDANSTATRLTGTFSTFPFNQDLAGLRTLTDISVDPFSGRVWVVGTGAQSSEAYFQDPDAGGDLDPNAGDNPWQANDATRFDDVFVVYADPSGNAWFGTDRGITGLLMRLLTVDRSRYLGGGTQAVATLEDLPRFADNGLSGETARVQVTVGSSTGELTATESGDSGRFTFPFVFQVAGGSDFIPPNIFQVTSSTDGVPVTVVYRFTDAEDQERELTALASWANVVDFEDDLWIGGPCFLHTLQH